MPTSFYPYSICTIGSVPSIYGYLVQPPIVWPSLAQAWNAESGSSFDGRYISPLGEVHGKAFPKRQDTFKVGTGGRTGRSFAVVNGTWQDDAYDNKYHCFYLKQPDASLSTSGVNPPEVVSSSSTADIEHVTLIVRKGRPPIADAASLANQHLAHESANNYAYVHLGYQSPDNQDYRVTIEYGAPIRLDYTYDAGATWSTVAVARDLGSADEYLRTHDDEIVLKVKPDAAYCRMAIEIGDGNWLVHQPDPGYLNPPKAQRSSLMLSDHLLPRNGYIRFVCRNGWADLLYLPNRHAAINLKKSPKTWGSPNPNASQATVVTNGLTQSSASQTDTPTVTTDGQTFGYAMTSALPDAGDGLGSSEPARLADASLVIPSVWSFGVPGAPRITTQQQLRVLKVVESQVVDEVTRTKTSRAVITCDNHPYFGTFGPGPYTGAYGNVAVSLQSSIGGPMFQRLTGVTDDEGQGVKFTNRDPVSLMEITAADKSRMMMVALADEVNFDGWCLYSAVRFLFEKGNIHPQYLNRIPYYRYGPAGYDCPYPILPAGMGLLPKLNYTPDRFVWPILQELVQDSGTINPNNGLQVPFYTGFDINGNGLFEPFAAYEQPITIDYYDTDPSGIGQIEEIEVFNSVADMRTDLHFQGLDANTFELLYLHLPMPPAVANAKGWREAWVERNARYASEAYLLYTAEVAAIQASLPTQTAVLKVPYAPWVQAGNQCTITHRKVLNGWGRFSIKEVRNTSGMMDTNGKMGYRESGSIIVARSSINTL